MPNDNKMINEDYLPMPAEDGSWVRYEDAKKAIEELEYKNKSILDRVASCIRQLEGNPINTIDGVIGWLEATISARTFIAKPGRYWKE
jgi:hypothetical protein